MAPSPLISRLTLHPRHPNGQSATKPMPHNATFVYASPKHPQTLLLPKLEHHNTHSAKNTYFFTHSTSQASKQTIRCKNDTVQFCVHLRWTKHWKPDDRNQFKWVVFRLCSGQSKLTSSLAQNLLSIVMIGSFVVQNLARKYAT
jgi:hypothetical protein